MDTSSELKVGIVLASLGRPDELAILITRLMSQTLPPSAIVLSVTKQADIPQSLDPSVRVVQGSAGLPAQRNRGMELLLNECDVVAFFDDDYVPSRFAVEGLARLFRENPDIAGATGVLLADGVGSGGLDPQEAERLVDEHDASYMPAPLTVTPRNHGLYGCNMAYRSKSVGNIRFDEALPLYAWQEDMDFAFLIRSNGRIVQSDVFIGVHCGVTKARSPGRRLGYSQIANPAYLVGKGTMTLPYALQLMLRNTLANHVKSFAPEPWIDRKGRMLGNWLAFKDLMIGKLRPDRILEMQSK